MKLRIEKIVYGGAGLAHLPAQEQQQEGDRSPAGKTVFTPGVLPGELVEVHINGDRRGYSTAGLDRILEPSKERTLPGCEYYPACGGCQMQHADAAYQVQLKLNVLRETLERAHLPGFHLLADSIGIHSGRPWGYRNRIRLQIAPGPRPALGYRERGSHIHQPVTHCPIAAPVLEEAIAAVLGIAQRSSEASALLNLSDEIEFFANAEQDALLVWLRAAPFSPARPAAARRSARRSFPGEQLRPGDERLRPDDKQLQRSLEEFAQQLHEALPALTGAGLFRSAGNDRGSHDRDDRQDRLAALWGEDSLTYRVAGRPYRVSLGSFFQINRFLIPELLRLAVGGRSGECAWDLYSGAGLFARALDFEDVTAVESAPGSVSDLRHNLAGTGRRVVHSTTIEFLRSRIRGGPQKAPDVILMDPPRAGLGKDVCACLAQISARSLVYVSCDPATLSRDLQALLQSGYRLESLHLVDLFPQTFHLETVAALTRD